MILSLVCRLSSNVSQSGYCTQMGELLLDTDRIIHQYNKNKQLTSILYSNTPATLAALLNTDKAPVDRITTSVVHEYQNILHNNNKRVEQIDSIRDTINTQLNNVLQSNTTPIIINTPIPVDQSDTINDSQRSQLQLYEQQKQQQQYNDQRLALIQSQRNKSTVQPTWHAPWKLYRVISGHTGWVRCVSVDSSNEWFATGSADRTIKIWDLPSGQLKLTLTGHINTVRALCISSRSPYLFSAGEDNAIKCWDLETNQVIRQYHGHLSGVYCMALHPTLDILVTGGRDSTARIWDIRTKKQIGVLGGHTNTVGSVVCQSTDPQVITGSHDSTIKCWDLAKQQSIITLTHHKKSIRSLITHPLEHTFLSGAADNIKIWKSIDGTFIRNISGHHAIVNSLAINRDNILISAADNGSIKCYDYKSGYNYQSIQHIPQPGSLSAESGVYQCVYDQTGSRLITVNADKTIQMYKPDHTATPETHPIIIQSNKRPYQT